MKAKWLTLTLIAACVMLLITNIALERRIHLLKTQNGELISLEGPLIDSFVRRIEGHDLSNRATALDLSTQSQQTLLMVLSPMCRYCADNWPYWHELLRSAPGANVVFADTSGDVDLGYFQKVGVSPPLQVVKVGLQTKLAYKLNTTPTTILLGPGGRVKGVWIGLLSSDEVSAIKRKLNEQ